MSAHRALFDLIEDVVESHFKEIPELKLKLENVELEVYDLKSQIFLLRSY